MAASQIQESHWAFNVCAVRSSGGTSYHQERDQPTFSGQSGTSIYTGDRYTIITDEDSDGIVETVHLRTGSILHATAEAFNVN